MTNSGKKEVIYVEDSVATTIEIYDEVQHNFREVRTSDGLHRTSVSMSSYNYYGVVFPKNWCHL